MKNKQRKRNLNMEHSDYGMRLLRTTSFGRKRVALPNICIDFDEYGGEGDCLQIAPLKRRCSRDLFSSAGFPTLEDLPQDILVGLLFYLFIFNIIIIVISPLL